MSLINDCNQVLYLLHTYPTFEFNKKVWVIGPETVLVYPYGFFDGATIVKMGGADIYLAISNVHSFFLKMGCGHNSNTKAELLALWALLFFAKGMDLPSLHIFGDSFVVIN